MASLCECKPMWHCKRRVHLVAYHSILLSPLPALRCRHPFKSSAHTNTHTKSLQKLIIPNHNSVYYFFLSLSYSLIRCSSLLWLNQNKNPSKYRFLSFSILNINAIWIYIKYNAYFHFKMIGWCWVVVAFFSTRWAPKKNINKKTRWEPSQTTTYK